MTRPSTHFLLWIRFSSYMLAPERERAVLSWIRSALPAWGQFVRVDLDDEGAIPTSLDDPAVLRQATIDSRGRWQRSQEPAAPSEPEGDFHLKGATPDVSVMGSSWRRGFIRIQNEHTFGNGLTVEVLCPVVEGMEAAQWIAHAMRSACEMLSPQYAIVFSEAEFSARNMDFSNGMRAIGPCISDGLPGLYWLNYFGRELTEFLGAEKLLSAPVPIRERIGEGILIGLHTDPDAWSTPEFEATWDSAMEWIGREYFFDRRFPDRPIVRPPLVQRN